MPCDSGIRRPRERGIRSRAHGITISVTAAVRRRGGRYAHEAVADAGIGADVARPVVARARSCAAASRCACAASACRPRTRGPTPPSAACGGSAAGRGCARASAAGRTRSASGAPRRRPRRTMCAARSTSSPSTRDRRLVGRRPGPAQHRLQARDELARAERLGHVVVGAGLERAHLLVLLADRGEHDDRHLASTRAAARQTSMPSPSGSTRSMIAASGGCSDATSSASAAV